jgi:hypothetical protein
VATAPLNLVYVAHGDRMKDVSPEERRLYASVDAGFHPQMSICSALPRGSRRCFAAQSTMRTCPTLKLPAQQFVDLAQTVDIPEPDTTASAVFNRHPDRLSGDPFAPGTVRSSRAASAD